MDSSFFSKFAVIIGEVNILKSWHIYKQTHFGCVSVKQNRKKKYPKKSTKASQQKKNFHKPSNKEKKNHAAISGFKKAPQKLLSGKQDPKKSNAVKERTNSTLECKTKLLSSPFP